MAIFEKATRIMKQFGMVGAAEASLTELI